MLLGWDFTTLVLWGVLYTNYIPLIWYHYIPIVSHCCRASQTGGANSCGDGGGGRRRRRRRRHRYRCWCPDRMLNNYWWNRIRGTISDRMPEYMRSDGLSEQMAVWMSVGGDYLKKNSPYFLFSTTDIFCYSYVYHCIIYCLLLCTTTLVLFGCFMSQHLNRNVDKDNDSKTD